MTIQYGLIEDGVLKGRRVVLSPRDGLPNNIYLVEQGTFFNGAPMFTTYCLVCDKQVPGTCPNQKREDHQ